MRDLFSSHRGRHLWVPWFSCRRSSGPVGTERFYYLFREAFSSCCLETRACCISSVSSHQTPADWERDWNIDAMVSKPSLSEPEFCSPEIKFILLAWSQFGQSGDYNACPFLIQNLAEGIPPFTITLSSLWNVEFICVSSANPKQVRQATTISNNARNSPFCQTVVFFRTIDNDNSFSFSIAVVQGIKTVCFLLLLLLFCQRCFHHCAKVCILLPSMGFIWHHSCPSKQVI